ncbi:uncharacterized protein LOC121616777 isoform X2 [Chelmon rostratus]|uniref:uncharacterized protein LOC121616777 isoform X2 n=1 Tax=Chelmon rostratus TaxID=109905 RepID=UPI001BEBB7BB|nr:uncharacterized protein LOC121616777 isoform X2 [Chelmon rostratus]
MRTNNQSWKKKHFDDEKTLSIYILGFILDEYGNKPVGETVVSVNFFTVTQKRKKHIVFLFATESISQQLSNIKEASKGKTKMSDISEEEWKTSLTSILEELDSQQYSKMLECLKKIPKGQKTTRSREKMPQKIIEHYGLEESINAIKDAMDQVPRRDSTVQDLLRPFLDKLRNKHEERSKEKKRKHDPLEENGERPAADQKKSCRTDKETNSRSWEKSISDLKSSSELLDTHVIAGKVVQKSGLRTYQTREHVKKFFFYLAVVDETASIKLMVYGKIHHQTIKEDNFYRFRKLIRDDNGVVKVTSQTIVSQMNSVPVPEELEIEARTLIYSESPVYFISKAKLSADKTGVSVQGTITEIDPIKPVTVQNKEKKKMQTFQLRDDTDSIRICMWGEETKQCKGLSVGDVIKVQSVGIQNVSIELIGIIKATKKETHLEAVLNQQSALSRLQRVQNAAARFLTNTSRRQHITPVLFSLHWLPVSFRIDFKILLFVFKALNGLLLI